MSASFQRVLRRLILAKMLLLASIACAQKPDIVINEIDLLNLQMEMKKVGTTNVDIFSFWICNFPQNHQFFAQTLIYRNLNRVPRYLISYDRAVASSVAIAGEWLNG